MTSERYSHGHHASVLKSHRWRTAENSAAFLLPHLSAGLSLLDVGCGPGNITADLATRLGTGSAVGIDLSEEVVALAREAYATPAHANLSFEVGNVYELDFATEQFDVVYAHQVLQHLGNPIAALEEMRRVLKPGGLLAVRDGDFGAFVWSPHDPVLDRWMALYHALSKRNGGEADAGRHLNAWVRAAGFEELKVSSSNWTYQTPEERAWWGGLWAERVLDSDFARHALEYGLADDDELAAIADGWRRWIDEPDGVFLVVSVEVLARR
jgi:ubiquinone/menaquinone biosynthesis C-methylase UbiE